LATLKAVGYAGVIGIECSPSRSPTADALVAFRALCAAA
jgi:hydroxypyruvate isomerase